MLLLSSEEKTDNNSSDLTLPNEDSLILSVELTVFPMESSAITIIISEVMLAPLKYLDA